MAIALADTPNIEEAHSHTVDTDRLFSPARATHLPHIQLLGGVRSAQGKTLANMPVSGSWMRRLTIRN
ncbi:hypothetical protein [Aliiroseovarius sp. F47248L]|uniref:hypothetical protein n=1 Tax=Aliiroseovarius sp. F47248L TaxID=2926420 RepID=UPI001FF4AE5E|nr:hypothetical protein [Aliiroseovarius sp. F47248L]